MSTILIVDDGTPEVFYTAQSQFDSEHIRLLTDKLVATAEDLKTANARLRGLINIGMDFAAGLATAFEFFSASCFAGFSSGRTVSILTVRELFVPCREAGAAGTTS